MSDPRPMISAKLLELALKDHVWMTWPNPRMRLKLRARTPEDVWLPAHDVIFVHRSRFGLGTLVHKDGQRLCDCTYADGRSGPSNLFAHDVRAIVVESHVLPSRDAHDPARQHAEPCPRGSTEAA